MSIEREYQLNTYRVYPRLHYFRNRLLGLYPRFKNIIQWFPSDVQDETLLNDIEERVHRFNNPARIQFTGNGVLELSSLVEAADWLDAEGDFTPDDTPTPTISICYIDIDDIDKSGQQTTRQVLAFFLDKWKESKPTRIFIRVDIRQNVSQQELTNYRHDIAEMIIKCLSVSEMDTYWRLNFNTDERQFSSVISEGIEREIRICFEKNRQYLQRYVSPIPRMKINSNTWDIQDFTDSMLRGVVHEMIHHLDCGAECIGKSTNTTPASAFSDVYMGCISMVMERVLLQSFHVPTLTSRYLDKMKFTDKIENSASDGTHSLITMLKRSLETIIFLHRNRAQSLNAETDDRTAQTKRNGKGFNAETEDLTHEGEIEDQTAGADIEDKLPNADIEHNARIEIEHRTSETETDDTTPNGEIEYQKPGTETEDKTTKDTFEGTTPSTRRSGSLNAETDERTAQAELNGKASNAETEDKTPEGVIEDQTAGTEIEDKIPKAEIEDNALRAVVEMEHTPSETEREDKTPNGEKEYQTPGVEIEDTMPKAELEDITTKDTVEDKTASRSGSEYKKELISSRKTGMSQVIYRRSVLLQAIDIDCNELISSLKTGMCPVLSSAIEMAMLEPDFTMFDGYIISSIEHNKMSMESTSTDTDQYRRSALTALQEIYIDCNELISSLKTDMSPVISSTIEMAMLEPDFTSLNKMVREVDGYINMSMKPNKMSMESTSTDPCQYRSPVLTAPLLQAISSIPNVFGHGILHEKLEIHVTKLDTQVQTAIANALERHDFRQHYTVKLIKQMPELFADGDFTTGTPIKRGPARGTAGGYARGNNTEDVYALTCAHVVRNMVSDEDEDVFIRDNMQYRLLGRSSPQRSLFRIPGKPLMDFAAVKVDDSIKYRCIKDCWKDENGRLQTGILVTGDPRSDEVQLQLVYKYGAKTGLTFGTVVCRNYGVGGDSYLVMIETLPGDTGVFMDRGDCGSVVCAPLVDVVDDVNIVSMVTSGPLDLVDKDDRHENEKIYLTLQLSKCVDQMATTHGLRLTFT